MPKGIYKRKPFTTEWRRKIGLASKRNWKNLEMRKKIKIIRNSEEWKKKVYTKQRNKKISQALKGKPTWILGKHHTEETKRKMAIRFGTKEEQKRRLKVRKKKASFKYSQKYPEKIKAHRIADKNIKISKFQLCEECGKRQAEHRHHEDYLKPLEVKLMCNRCHTELHRGLKSPRS